MAISLDQIKTKRQKLGNLAEQAEEVRLDLEAKATEDRELRSKGETPKNETRIKELDGKFEAIHRDIDSLSAEIERDQRQWETENALRMAGQRAEPVIAGKPDTTPGADDEDRDPTEKERRELARKARETYLRWGFGALNPEQRQAIQRPDTEALPAEVRAQAVGNDTAGGILVPQGEMQPMNEALSQFGWFMDAPVTFIRTTHGREIPIPTNNDTGNKGRRLGENVAASETSLTFNAKKLNAYIYTTDYILVPFDLLQDTEFDLEGFIGRKSGERTGRILSDEFTNFSGASGPEGIITGSTLGRTGPTGQTTTIKTDDIYELKHSVDPVYRGEARWMFHDNTLLAVKKLKDNEGNPLWQANLAGGTPNTIDGDPYIINQDMPTMAASAKSVIYGALRNFYVREVTQRVVLRLTERFAEYGQVAFLNFSRWDAKLIDAGTNPVKYYQNAAS